MKIIETKTDWMYIPVCRQEDCGWFPQFEHLQQFQAADYDRVDNFNLCPRCGEVKVQGAVGKYVFTNERSWLGGSICVKTQLEVKGLDIKTTVWEHWK